MNILYAALLLLVAMLLLHRIISNKDNNLEWADLVSSPSIVDRRQRADWNKIGKGCGVFLAVYLPLTYANSDRFEPVAGTLLMAASLAYLAMVDGYGAYLRSKQGTVQTTTTTEPPYQEKKTVVETISPSGLK